MGKLSFQLFDVIVAAGIVQAVIMAIILIIHPVKSRAKTLFTGILLTLAALSFKILLHTLGLWNLPLFRYFPLAVDTLLPPLLYLYALAVTGNAAPKYKVALYFIPTVVFAVYALVVYLLALAHTDMADKDELAKGLFFNPVKIAEDIVAVISAITYWLLGFRRVTDYRKWLFNSQSDTKFYEYTWLRNILVITGILILALTALVALEDLFTRPKHSFVLLQLFYIYLAIITYYLTFKGYAIYGNTQYGAGLPVLMVDNELSTIATNSELAPEYEIIKEQIRDSLANERLYLNAELSLKDLAKHIGYPPATVSAVINQCFRVNFRTLVNQYRVQEVKARLKNPPNHLSLLGIALDCGFNSEASFYRIFRQETGVSPNDYLQRIKS